MLAVAMKNRDVVLLDSMSLVASSTLSFPGSVWATFKDLGGNLEFSPNDEWLAFAGGETVKGLTVWSLKDGQALTLSEGRQYGSDWVGHVGFSRDGSRLISVANDRKITFWEWDEEKRQWSASDSRLGHQGDIWTLDVSPNGETVATGSSDRTVRLWSTLSNRELGLRRDFAGNQFVRTFHIGGQFLHDLSWGGRYAIVRKSKKLALCDTRTATTYELPFSGNHAQISTDGNLAAVEEEGAVRLYRAKGPARGSWHQIQSPKVVADSDFPGWEAGFRFSPRQNYLAIAKKNGGIFVWNIDNGSVTEFPTTYQKIGDFAFSPDELLLVATSHQHLASACEVFDLHRRKRVLHAQGGPGAFSIALILPGNAVLATADEHASVSLWNLKTDSPASKLSQRFANFGEARAGLRAFAASPNGRLLATVGAWDTQIHLWDAAIQQEVLVLRSEVPVWSLDFSLDGNTLTSACGVMVHRWEVPSLDEIKSAELALEQARTPEQ